MITPAQIKKKALRKYGDFLKAALSRQAFFPLSIPGKKGNANQPLEVLFPALKLLLEGSKDKLGYGYEVRLKTVNTRHAGAISVPEDIYFDNPLDYLKYIEKEAEFVRFQKTVLPSVKALPVLLPWLQSQPLQALKHLDEWGNLVKVCRYFAENPQPNYYVRELPIEVPPTFIDRHESILTELLTAVLPPQAYKKSKVFAERFGLKYAVPLLRLRVSGAGVLPDFPPAISDFALPPAQLNELNIFAETIYLVEDEDCFLTFPLTGKSMVLHTAPHSVSMLNKLTFLRTKSLVFWGDISVAAFQKLSNLRGVFPQIQSLLMDEQTLEKYESQVVSKKETAVHLPNLSAEERGCYSALGGEKVLLQREIWQGEVEGALDYS